jgi:DNA-binding CsgD family transcriptional regulator
MLISRRIGFLLSRTSIALGGAVLVSIAFLVVIGNNYFNYPANIVAFFAECCFGFGVALLLLSWVEFFSFVSPTAVVMYWMFSAVLSVIFYLLFYLFYSLLISWALCIIAPASYLILRMATRTFAQTPKKKPVRAIVTSSFNRVFLWAGYFVTVYIFAHTFFNPNDSSMVTSIASLLALVLLLIIFLYSKEVNHALTYRITIVLMSLGLLCGLLFGIFSMVTLLLVSVSYRIIGLLVLLLSTGTARLFKVSSTPLYGVIVIAECVGSILGKVLNLTVYEVTLLPVDIEIAVIAAAVFLLILIPIVLFPESDFVNRWSLSDSLSLSETRELAVITACDQLAKSHQLSGCEHAVLLLVSRGVPQSQIAKDLYIAPGTVRAHIAHIYRKLDMHSKDDLSVFINQVVLENEILNKVD